MYTPTCSTVSHRVGTETRSRQDSEPRSLSLSSSLSLASGDGKRRDPGYEVEESLYFWVTFAFALPRRGYVMPLIKTLNRERVANPCCQYCY